MILRNFIGIFILIWSISLISSCNKVQGKLDGLVQERLKEAGNNREELEKVLNYYSSLPSDSNKLYAAKFLIAHMDRGKVAIVPAPDDRHNYDTILKILLSREDLEPWDEGLSVYYKLIDSLLEEYPVRYIVQPDVTNISSDLLINNIDNAFTQWEKTPWKTQYSLDDFCRYVLPYRVSREPLEDWRTVALKFQMAKEDSVIQLGDLFTIGYELIKHSGISYNIAFDKFRYDMRFEDAEQIKRGECGQIATHIARLFRSRGIPSAVDQIPQWANRSLLHIWNVLIYPENKIRDISFFEGGKNAMFYKPSKIYRRNYDIQDYTIVYKYQNKEDIPPFFTNFCLSDVTADYGIPITDIKVENVKKDRHKILYLCTFDNIEWKPVAYAEAKNRTALFKNVARGILPGENVPIQYINMGDGIILLPAYYYKEGIKPAANPIILREDGRVEEIVADMSQLKRVVLTRKYPMDPKFYTILTKMVEGRFEASNDLSFKNSESMCVIESPEFIDKKIQLADSYRYVRYIHPDTVLNSIAEVTFFQGEQKLYPDSIYQSKKVLARRPINNINDNDPLSYYEYANLKGNYIVFDFGKPVNITRIKCLSRNDDNGIVKGESYELCFWKDGWESLGVQKAKENRLEYDNVPEGALLLLHNKTKGKEERIFLYKNGEQEWY